MTESQNHDQNLSGLQLAIFELIWPAFDWIKTIHASKNTNTPVIHIQTNKTPSTSDWEDLLRLINEIININSAKHQIQVKVTHSNLPPIDKSFQEIMSNEIFKMIAKDVAPWRLDIGR